MLISYPLLPSAIAPGQKFSPVASWTPPPLPKTDRSKQRLDAEPGDLTESDESIFDKELIDKPTPVSVPNTPLNQTDAVAAYSEASHGTYPVSADGRWHAGVHLGVATTLDAVHAIADGVLVAALYPKLPIKDKAGNDCDNGFVLLKHETEIGARLIPATQSQPAKLEPIKFGYFSLYMHLASQDAEQKAGVQNRKNRSFARPLISPKIDELMSYADAANAPRVYRREVLGYPGKMYGQTQIHCEVFATDGEFKKLSDTEALVKQGKSSDRLPYGKLYFYIPTGTSFLNSPSRAVNGFISKNADSIKEEVEKKKITENKTVTIRGREVTRSVSKTVSEPTGRYYDSKDRRSVYFPKQHAGTNDVPLVLEMWYHQGTRFYRVLKEVQAGGSKQYVPLLTGDKAFEMKGYEYDLYARALRMYPDCPSAGTDLMRYGRIVGVDPAPANQADCWLAMPFGTGADQMGYIDLAKASVLKFSDADFPHFKGWTRVKESGVHATDGKVDVQFLSALLATADTNKDGTTTADEFARYLKSNADVRRRLRYLMCQAPSEWDDAYNTSRYDGLQQPGKAFHNKPADFEQFKTFIKKFQFWGQARSALAAHGVSSSSLWYFHPLQFIKQFRKANWLTLDEMTQLTPLAHIAHEKPGAAGTVVITNYNDMRTHLVDGYDDGGSINWGHVVPANIWLNFNWMCTRYGIDTLQRKAHFWAQMSQETGRLGGVTENGDKAYFLSLNYDKKNGNLSEADAETFRGRGLIQITGREKYAGYSAYRMTQDYTAAPKHELIAKNAYETCDSSGWYYSYYRPKTCAAADGGTRMSDVTAVTKAVNGGTNHLENRQTFFVHALHALGDQIGTLPKEFSPLTPDTWNEYEQQKREAAAKKIGPNKHGTTKKVGVSA